MAKADTDYRPRLEQLTQPDIDAHEVLDKLDELNDRSTPTRQGYLFSIAGKKARLFDLNNTEILVRAEQVEHYLDKGFTVKSQAKTEDGGTSRLHDVVPVLTQAGTEPVIRQVEEQKEADAAKAEADEAKAKKRIIGTSSPVGKNEDQSLNPRATTAVPPPAGTAPVVKP